MDPGESSGESSSSGRENGAASSDTDRPHKKARFPWQVKGKHHLKNQADHQIASSVVTPEEPEPTILSSETETDTDQPENENYSSIFGNGIRPNRRQSARRFIWHGTGRRSICSTSDTSPTAPLPIETVVSLAESIIHQSEMASSYGRGSSEVRSLLEQEDICAILNPTTTVLTEAMKEAYRLRNEENRCISRWQDAQTVKGCFDNTINRVLESWLSAPAAAQDRFLGLGYDRIVEALPDNDDNVENVGILMAIHAHGLRYMERDYLSDDSSEQLETSLDNYNTMQGESDSVSSTSDDSEGSEDSEDLEGSGEVEPGSLFSSPWLRRNEIINRNIPVPAWRKIVDDSNADQPEPFQYLGNNVSANGEDAEQNEFINAAVTQAIKTKGMMAAGTDFG